MCHRKVCSISRCVCPMCGNSFPIPRRPGRARERNHIKDIYCPFCGEVTKMTEIREGDYLPRLDNIMKG